MKTLLPVFLLFFCSVTYANESRSLAYWCDPSIRLQGLEAVLVSEIDGVPHLEVYTESRTRWGAVDQKLEQAALTINTDNHQFISLNQTVQLTIDTNGTTPSQPMQFFEANFVDTELGYDMKMFCEFLP